MIQVNMGKWLYYLGEKPIVVGFLRAAYFSSQKMFLSDKFQ